LKSGQKFKNFQAAIALNFVYFNFVKTHGAMDERNRLLKANIALIKENKRLQVEFRNNLAELNGLFRKFRANLKKNHKLNKPDSN